VEAIVTSPLRVAHLTTVDLTLRFLLLDQLRRLKEEGYEVAGISAPGPWVRDLEAAGIRHIPWPHATRSWSPGSDARAFAELVRILQRERFDILHTHNPKPGILGRVAGRLTGVPCVVNTVHGLYATRGDRPARRIPVLALEWMAARFSDLELYQSEEDLAWAREIRLVDESKGVLLGNGTDLFKFDPAAVSQKRKSALRRSLGIPEGALVVGTAGRLVAEKGFREFFAAARDVRAAMPGVAFLVVGGGDPDKADAISSDEVERAGKDVVFSGWREDVRDLLAIMDVFVLASWREGVPRSAIEAAAMARPLVLTDIRGCREVGRHGREALLVPPRNPERLAMALIHLLRDRALREQLGAAARVRALASFDERKVSDTVVARYGMLLEMKGLRPQASADQAGNHMRAARPEDAPALARIHRQALPDSFLPTLGDRFLKRLYRALATDPEAVAVVAEDGVGITGFATGVASVKRFYRRFFLRHGIPAALAAAPRMARPSVRRRLRETAAHPQRSGRLPDAELLSIAVIPERTSRGVGRALTEATIAGLAKHGATEIKVVVHAENEGANRFYSKVGFRPLGDIAVHDGATSNVWVISCP
jgi:glycosyltransferase involved in cell wall biosynthesis/ribosomal protein S18 acetylase RimI-like enzyme